MLPALEANLYWKRREPRFTIWIFKTQIVKHCLNKMRLGAFPFIFIFCLYYSIISVNILYVSVYLLNFCFCCATSSEAT